MSERIPPSNIDAEKLVLGAMLTDSDVVMHAIDQLTETDFFYEAHRYIFQAMQTEFRKGSRIELVIVRSELSRMGRLEDSGNITYLSELVMSLPTTANAKRHVQEIKDLSMLRKLIIASSKISAEAFSASDSAQEIIESAENEILKISTLTGSEKTYSSIGDILVQTYSELEERRDNKGSLSGIPTGFVDLDRMTSGLHNSDLIIIAARPGVGKSTIMLNMMQQAAMKAQVPCAFFSLEMDKIQLAQRLLCAEATVDLYNLRNGYLSDSDWAAIAQAIGPLAAAPIYIDDTAGLSITELRSRVRRMKMELGIGLVFIDYLQLMTPDEKSRNENRQQIVSGISRMLKALAKDMNIPVIVASQLNRNVEKRDNKRPTLADLLDSGGIEANADIVMFLHREDYNNPDTDNQNTAEIILAKQRNGPTGTVNLYFLKQYNKFVNGAPKSEE